MKVKFVDRQGWVRWAREKPGKHVIENGKWIIRKEGSRWRTYIKDRYDERGRFLRLERIPTCRTLREAQEWVDEFDVRGMNELVENPRRPQYLRENAKDSSDE